MTDTSEKHKLIVIGGGPAGLSAALYAARAGLNPLVFAGSPSGGQLMLTSDVDNFPGQQTILGPDLIRSLRTQAQAFGTTIIDENIISVEKNKECIVLKTHERTLYSESLIVATGAKALWLGLPSEERLRGKGVSACATCDGFFFRNKIVAVVGGGDTAMEETHTLSRFAKKVFLIHRRDSFKASKIMIERVNKLKNVSILLDTNVKEVLGEQSVTGVVLSKKFEGSDTLPLNGLFIAIGHKPDTELFKDLLRCDDKGYIFTSQSYALHALGRSGELSYISQFNPVYGTMTSVPAIFAAGDCVDYVYRQAGTAAGTGIAAALDAARWLSTDA